VIFGAFFIPGSFLFSFSFLEKKSSPDFDGLSIRPRLIERARTISGIPFHICEQSR
jgi:hypothetical protein